MAVLNGYLVNAADETRNDVFDGYAVTATFLVSTGDGSGTFAQQSLTERLVGFNSKFGFDVPPLEALNREADLKIRVQDRAGTVVADEVSLDWPSLNEWVDSGRPVRIDVQPAEEPSTPVSVTGRVVFKDDPDRETGFGGYRVSASYSFRDARTGTYAPGSASTDLADANTFRLVLPDQDELGTTDVRVTAKYPDGQDAAAVDVPIAEVDEPLTLMVDPAETVVLSGGGAAPTPRLRGKVVDQSGKVDLRNRQIILWGTNAAAAEAELRPILVETTDAMGNFAAPWPATILESAVATVEGTHNVAPEHGVPIDLVGSAGAGGTLPLFLYVVVTAEPTEGADSDCGCHDPGTPRLPDQEDLVGNPSAYSQDIGANCVNLTVPNRTLEEFSYTLAVRTTEPEIKGTTLSDLDERRKRIHELLQAVTPSMGRPTTRDTGAVVARHVEGRFGSAVLGADVGGDPDRSIEEPPPPPPELKTVPGRGALSVTNSVDWDSSATFYQATTIAHGHILTFKQVWKADGYSLGDLVYSLPLAPGQKKQVVIFDWDRTQYGARDEASHEDEALDAFLSHNRDINEIASGSFRENLSGGSKSTSWGAALGGGAAGGGTVGAFFLGATAGHSFGIGSSSSSAWQNSSRNVSATGLSQLRDQVQQGASAVRNQRSTVVQVQRESERFKVQTEVVANHNHCHALTVEYFEVLRHYAIEQQVSEVTECLFIPMLMSAFDDPKVLRWLDVLRLALVDPNPPRVKRLPSGGISMQRRPLADGFDAIERKAVNWVGTDFPDTTYADEEVVDLSGDLTMTFVLNRPKDKDGDLDSPDDLAWNFFKEFMPWSPLAIYAQFFKGRSHADRDAIFEREIAPKIVEGMVDQLSLHAVTPAGQSVPLAVDTTLVSTYRREAPLYVTLRATAASFGLRRSDIHKLVLTTSFDLSGTDYNKIVVRGANLRYRTRHYEGVLFANASVNNDLRSVTVPGGGSFASDGVTLPTPLSTEETRNLRNEDRELATRLVKHLNANLERYHRALWLTMDPDRRYMLLDGFLAPNAGGKSVASVVENRVIGIAGNSLIMPVAPGHKLDPGYEIQPVLDERGDLELDSAGNVVYVSLLDHYRPRTPAPPYRVSVPTRGVFAEAVMGACNSCEKKDETRFWRWEESPNPDEPTAINPITTGTPQWNEQTGLTPTAFPNPMINIQNAPAAPAPGSTLGGAFDLLGTAGVFKDITGLDQNQKNAIQALTSNVEAAKHYADKATELAKLAANQRGGDSTIEAIKKAEADGTITKEKASELTEDALRAKISGKTTSDKEEKGSDSKIADSGSGAISAGRAVKVTKTNPDGTQITVDQKQASDPVAIDLSKATAAIRAFDPPAGEFTVTIAPAIVGTRPAGSTLTWEGDLEFLPRPDDTVEVIPHSGGVKKVTCSLVDKSGNTLSTASTHLSVPVLVSWDTVTVAFAGDLGATLTEFKISDKQAEILTRAEEIATQLAQGPNLRFFPDAYETVADMYRVTIKIAKETSDPQYHLVTTPYRNVQGSLGGEVEIGVGKFSSLPRSAGESYTALTEALRSSASPSAALKTFTAEFIARVIGRLAAYGVMRVLDPTGPKATAVTLAEQCGYTLPDGVTASAKPGDYTDVGLAAMKLPDALVADVKKRLPVPPEFT